MDQDILDTILKDTFSLSQFKRRVRLLKSNLLKIFFGGVTNKIISPEQDSDWLKSLPPGFYSAFNKDNVYKIFSIIEQEIPKLSILTMYLTFEPDNLTLNQVGTYSRKTFNSPLLLLDIKVDPNLIAGTALVWKGVYQDYSLRAKIEEKKEEISEGFKRFLR